MMLSNVRVNDRFPNKLYKAKAATKHSDDRTPGVRSGIIINIIAYCN